VIVQIKLQDVDIYNWRFSTSIWLYFGFQATRYGYIYSGRRI